MPVLWVHSSEARTSLSLVQLHALCPPALLQKSVGFLSPVFTRVSPSPERAPLPLAREAVKRRSLYHSASARPNAPGEETPLQCGLRERLMGMWRNNKYETKREVVLRELEEIVRGTRLLDRAGIRRREEAKPERAAF